MKYLTLISASLLIAGMTNAQFVDNSSTTGSDATVGGNLEVQGTVDINATTTTTDQPSVDVRDASNDQIFLVNDLGQSSYSWMSKAGDAGLFYSDRANGDHNVDKGFVIASRSGSYGGIRIAKNGHVGFGIKDPTQRVDVNGTMKAKRVMVQGSEIESTSSAMTFTSKSALAAQMNLYKNGKVMMRSMEGQPIEFFTQETGQSPFRAMHIDGDGQIGIGGTVDPNAQLHVYGTNGVLRLDNQNTDPTSYPITLGVHVKTASTKAIEVYNNGSSIFSVRGSGQVRIGENDFNGTSINWPSTAKLAVAGSIYAQDLTCRMPDEWPDYVFDSNYELMPLERLQDYVKDHHHLPGVPSEAELNDTGLWLTAMTTAQMEKIEELTLYVLQLKAEIDALKQAQNKQ